MVEGTIKRTIGFCQEPRSRAANHFGNPDVNVVETTAGRVIFNQICPKELGFFNKSSGKKQLSDIIWRSIRSPARSYG